ncbi:MAG TPA: ATP-binding protein [Thiotrichales bacterium]|nr:ATP-binding protein [Thiotrichales bacterium]
MPDDYTLEYPFDARPEALRGMRRALCDALERAGVGEAQKERIILAVNEACMNVIQHAYGGSGAGPVELRLRSLGGRLEFELEDHGIPVEGCCIQPRELDDLRPGGLGVFFIRAIMDEVAYGRTADGRGNLLRMSIALHEEG